MRHARPNRTTKGVEGDRFVNLSQLVAQWLSGKRMLNK